METVTHLLSLNGHCSMECRDSVSNVSGHSSQVVKDTYLLENRYRDAENVQQLAAYYKRFYINENDFIIIYTIIVIMDNYYNHHCLLFNFLSNKV